MAASDPTSNKYCSSTDLGNEASVESFFVLRLLKDLGYQDQEMKTKEAIDELRVPKGRKREPYKPDFLLVCGDKPRWLIDAKNTGEDIENWTYQCAGYSLLFNRKFTDNPLRFYMLTNGLLTRVYAWDQEEAILSLRFADFVNGNPRFETLKKLLGAATARQGWESESKIKAPTGPILTRPTMEVVKRAFLRCHRIIWKAEKVSPQAAFVKFAKLLFVKLWEDRRLRDNPAWFAKIGAGDPLPPNVVRFSTDWITQEETHDPNPIGNTLFRQLAESIEQEIAQRKRKRIFDPAETLGISPGTVTRVVKELQDWYLFGIDEDLNGRMFEAFLTATMRGQSLGQYFTPRSVVKLMTRLANLKATREKVERVLDGCCGTGGFLIEVLTDMRQQVYNNGSLTTKERKDLLDEIANEAIFGIDAGTDPPIARIARINMYLHGDGGSRVYMTDGLRRPPKPGGADTVEVRQEVAELSGILQADPLFEKEGFFDAALTNPPFSMDYSASVPDELEVLQTYDLHTYGGKRRSSLHSSIMFIERYWGLLVPGGRLLTVIDDSVLSGRKFAFAREFVRERFVIRAIISLHGDAFQRSGARAKTSVLYLTKRKSDEESQPNIFVYESRYIGLDDVVPRAPASVSEAARAKAVQEIGDIVHAFGEFQQGKGKVWSVPADKLTGRLDVKYLQPWSAALLEPIWQEAGATTKTLSDIVDSVWEPVTLEPDKQYTFLRISYAGWAEKGEQRLGKEVTYTRISKARADDIVVSNISAVYRAICVMPEGMEDVMISPEFTILRLKQNAEVDQMYLWSVLRSAAVIAEFLSGSSGVGRHRVDWGRLQHQLVPLLPYPRQKGVGDLYREAMRYEQEMRNRTEAAKAAIASLALEGELALDRLERAKPPK